MGEQEKSLVEKGWNQLGDKSGGVPTAKDRAKPKKNE